MVPANGHTGPILNACDQTFLRWRWMSAFPSGRCGVPYSEARCALVALVLDGWSWLTASKRTCARTGRSYPR
jgi:hypothetical protein